MAMMCFSDNITKIDCEIVCFCW